MPLLKKIKLIKTSIFVLIFLNVLSISTGLVFTINHWINKNDLQKEIQHIHDKQHSALIAQRHIYVLKKKKNNERDGYFYYGLVKLKSSLEKINLGNKVDLEDKKADLNQIWPSLEKELALKSLSLLEKQNLLYQEYINEKNELIIISLLTLVFGVILPFFILSLLYRALRKTQKIAEEKISSLFLKVTEQFTKKKDNDNSSQYFYLNILLVSIEELAPLVNHPIAQYVAKISRIINMQVKEQDKKTEQGNKKEPS